MSDRKYARDLVAALTDAVGEIVDVGEPAKGRAGHYKVPLRRRSDGATFQLVVASSPSCRYAFSNTVSIARRWAEGRIADTSTWRRKA